MSDNQLPPTDDALSCLRVIVESIPDPAFAGRLLRIYEEAARTIVGVGQLDLGKYEDMAETGFPDLSMWEEVAPIIRDTVMDINRLLTTVRELFPADTESGIGELIGEVINEVHAQDIQQALLERHKDEAVHYVQILANVLAAEISNLGERMRSPAVVSDRWNLLADLQEIRGKFRRAIEDMIFTSASLFASVSRAQVVPGFAAELAQAIAARRAVTRITRLMHEHHGRLRAASPNDLQERVETIIKDLDAFGKSAAYSALRIPDKRRIVEFRALLYQHRTQRDPLPLIAAVEEFAGDVWGSAQINNRSCLIEHDREVLAACGVELENAASILVAEPEESARLVGQATVRLEDAYGRHAGLDEYLRESSPRDFSRLSPLELESLIDRLRRLLADASDF